MLRCDDPIDIAVLVPNRQVTVTFPLPAELKSAIVGQDVYFVGYPLNDYDLTTNTNDGAVGFVRKAVFSAQQRGDGFTRIYLDGRNNRGFSGSPVVYAEPSRPNDFKVAGVVSGYRHDFVDVMKVDVIERSQITPDDRALNRIAEMADGTFRKLTPTGQVIADNTGIVIAYAIEHAVDLIRKSKVNGPEVKEVK